MWIEYIKVLLFMLIVRITQEHKVITVYIPGPPYDFVNKVQKHYTLYEPNVCSELWYLSLAPTVSSSLVNESNVRLWSL